MTNISKSTHQRPGDLSLRSARPSSTALPKYLHKRGSCFYFKRKIPRDVIDGFPQYQGQIWKALRTVFLEKAKLLLAVEVTEFDLTVAELRKKKARLNVGEHCLSTAWVTRVSSKDFKEMIDKTPVVSQRLHTRTS